LELFLLDGLCRELIGACVIIVQKIALSWMQKRESGRQDPCGGILADDQVDFPASPACVVLTIFSFLVSTIKHIMPIFGSF
jgi:hypothetical protein